MNAWDSRSAVGRDPAKMSGAGVFTDASVPVHALFGNGWTHLKNRQRLATAILHGYELLVSTDQIVRYQPDLGNLRAGGMAMITTSWPHIRITMRSVAAAIANVKSGGVVEVSFTAQESAADLCPGE